MGKTAVLFSGQGAQHSGMMKEAYETLPAARRVFDVASDSLGRDIAALCFNGSQEELNLTHNTQPCVLVADLAAYEVAKAQGMVADCFAGFSLGEYAALVSAGCLALEDAFPLIQLRADAMQSAVPVGQGGMAAVMKADAEDLRALCVSVEGYVECANYNSFSQIVVSGEASAVDALISACKERKIRVVKIPVSVPAHCKLLASAADVLADALNEVSLNDPTVPVYLNVDARPITTAEGLRDKMVQQVKSPVLWVDTLQNLWADGCTTFIECGPGTTLTGFVKKTLAEAQVISVE
ncbi:ACP S-malonyltransferase [Adlercreutzia sp. ZJ138]|uniref:ACP S-malonyltransferase n=1 Tax=Adlercreutzia sp. ZJ138 TaxID=2709405 RepID=UPI0013EC12F8|nr:ACP S-malonyltransferase [Adlercreutzia sp. ZJ138]